MKMVILSILWFTFSGCVEISSHPRNLLCSIVKQKLNYCADSKNSLQFDSYEHDYLKNLISKKQECSELKTQEKESCQKELIEYMDSKGRLFNQRKLCYDLRNRMRLRYGSLCDYMIGKE